MITELIVSLTCPCIGETCGRQYSVCDTFDDDSGNTLFDLLPFLQNFYMFITSNAMEKTKARPKNEKKFKEPRDYRVILLNDNYTPMDFVVEVLRMIFHKDELEANRLMIDIHRKGKGIVGQYPFDIAQTKTNQVHSLARQAEVPLRCVIEEV
ncbi:MAG: ATP-dependent Clp protease adaptor ClpS [Treponema sp.]|jgi:ATP-dependent Clp protease adaptor protein ClpS|nr:ATP-dependent Clp protease adaptor ClpS [Treponema sp.]